MKNTASTIHHTAADGYAATADTYVRGRPDYPLEISDWLSNQLNLHSESIVLDLGAGTGKFTPLLLKTGASVIAVEPVAEMLSKLSAALPRVEALAGTAESIPLRDESVDVVICAQAFHWFATAAALTEIHRVLKVGGKLGLVWNMRDASIDWVAKLDRIVNQHEGNVPRYYTGAWRKVFPFHGFSPLHEQNFSHGHTGSAEDVIINRVRSTSFIAALKPEEKANVEAQIRALIATEPTLRDKEIVTVPYKTAAFFSEKMAL